MRFLLMPAPPEGHEPEDDTRWWYDTRRPLEDPAQPFMAVQTEGDKDANDYRHVSDMRLLFNDAAEYYAVCADCRSVYGGMQWAGSTRGGHGWRGRAADFLEKHASEKGWCQFCDPVFGNGGWRLN